MRTLLIVLIRAYQYGISPLLGSHCRYYPSCSHYADSAIQRFGVIKGLWLTIARLLRCHPGHPGGFDPVPEKTGHGCQQHDLPEQLKIYSEKNK